jgi:hypothetical protein
MIRPWAVIGFALLLASAALADDPGATGYCSGNKPCLTTFHNSNTRVGVNSHETTLSPSNLPTASTSITGMDGMIYGQPLYVSNVPVSIGTCTTTRNMVYVATENNTVYAIDADNYSICGHQTLNKQGPPAESAIPVTALPLVGMPAAHCDNLTGSSSNGTVGVTSTGVIDPGNYNGGATNVWFVASAHQSGTNYISRLNAINITSLQIIDQLDLNTPINQGIPQGYPTFYTQNEDQRAALLLDKFASTANIYVGFGSFCDGSISTSEGYFGLVAEFDYSYASQKFLTTTAETFYPAGTTNGLQSGAGVWMSGGGPAADAAGNVYFATGNGPFTNTGTPQTFGESVVKLGGSLGATALEDYYTPNVWSALNIGSNGIQVVCSPGCLFPSLANTDWDLDSGGVVILTASSSSAAGELIAGGKEGVFYVINYCSSSTQCPTSTGWNEEMGGLDGGGYTGSSGSSSQTIGCTISGTVGVIPQCFQGIAVDPSKAADQGIRSTPAFWAPSGGTSYLYSLGVSTLNPGGYLRAFSFSSGLFNTTPATGTAPGGGYFKVPGAGPVVTWDGSTTGSALVWVLDTSAWKSSTNNLAVLTAYAAVPSSGTLLQKWTSGTFSEPGGVKFMAPTIANGKIYVAGQNVAPGCTGASCGGMLVVYYHQ